MGGRKSVINWPAPASLLNACTKGLQHVTVILTSRAYLWTTPRVLLTRVAHQEFKLLIWLRLSARLVNRDKDLIATTDAHHLPVRVHAQRPGKGLQAKQSESLRDQDSAIQKPDQNRNDMSHSLYNHPYAPNHIHLVKWTFDNQEVNMFSVICHDIPPISCRKQMGRKLNKYVKPHRDMHGRTKEPYFPEDNFTSAKHHCNWTSNNGNKAY